MERKQVKKSSQIENNKKKRPRPNRSTSTTPKKKRTHADNPEQRVLKNSSAKKSGSRAQTQQQTAPEKKLQTTSKQSKKPRTKGSQPAGKTPRKSSAPQQKESKLKKAASAKKTPRLKRPRALRYAQYAGEVLVTLLIIFFCIWFTINIRAHNVNGESMSPTFETGDRLFTNRNAEVARYDIITFFPGESSETYLKRVIAMPGDSIYVMGNTLYLFVGEVDAEEIPGIIYSAQLPDSTQVVTLDSDIASQLVDLKQIPENNYFVMGDNRQNSRDSRSLGLIDADQIEGVVNFRYYPFSEFGFVH